MIELAKYADMKICVAVSGGKDSMALLHYLYTRAREYGITLSALNCDHKIRGETSARDSAFVKEWCGEHNIPLSFFVWQTEREKTESAARAWRLECYRKALESGADAVATAHHMNDNAETVLFNLARGSSLSGMKGITDGAGIIRPLISCTRGQIDNYIRENNIPYVEDESNFTDDYTRNKIRHNVLPELEKAVPNAVNAIYRFSRLAADDEEYFDGIIKERNLVKRIPQGAEIAFCKEKVIFRRAVLKGLRSFQSDIKDYTAEHLERLYNLQFAENGKRFGFLNLTAYKEEGKIAIIKETDIFCEEVPFKNFCGDSFCGQLFIICESEGRGNTKTLKFDPGCIPESAVIRFMKAGDKFKRFGGGTKSLGDYFTDKKIPQRIRKQIPLIADGSEVLAVGGVEISDKIKITEKTEKIYYLVCDDYRALT